MSPNRFDGPQPIETNYRGHRFRSRLEARWAVFFDALRMEWSYEPEGFKLDAGDWYGNPPSGVTIAGRCCYLPDFWLPQVGMYAEVKPIWPSPDELGLAALLAQSTRHPVLILDGAPAERMYHAITGLSFEHGGWDIEMTEHDIQDGHAYWINERRFWTGDVFVLTDWVLDPGHATTDGHTAAVRQARSARFW